MPVKSLSTKLCTMADSSTQPRLPPAPGSGTTRGSERGACTMASSLSRSKASLPSRRTMKFRLLFWMRGKGRAGSSPRGLRTGSTSCSKYSSSHARVCGLQSAGPSSGTPSAARRGRIMSFRQRYCASTMRVARSWMASSCSAIDMPSAASCPPPSSCSCFRPETRISKNSSRLLQEMHRNFSRSSSGTLVSNACSSTRWLNSRNESSRLM